MRYKVKLNKTDEGYAVWCPTLPGCWSQEQIEEEVLENIKDAILAYLDTAEELSKKAESLQQAIHPFIFSFTTLTTKIRL